VPYIPLDAQRKYRIHGGKKDANVESLFTPSRKKGIYPSHKAERPPQLISSLKIEDFIRGGHQWMRNR